MAVTVNGRPMKCPSDCGNFLLFWTFKHWIISRIFSLYTKLSEPHNYGFKQNSSCPACTKCIIKKYRCTNHQISATTTRTAAVIFVPRKHARLYQKVHNDCLKIMPHCGGYILVLSLACEITMKKILHQELTSNHSWRMALALESTTSATAA